MLVFVYDLLSRFFRRQTFAFKLLTGLVLGAIAIAVMLAALKLHTGVIFDTRSVVLSMGTLFYGTIPGAIAGAVAAAYRASQGGPRPRWASRSVRCPSWSAPRGAAGGRLRGAIPACSSSTSSGSPST